MARTTSQPRLLSTCFLNGLGGLSFLHTLAIFTAHRTLMCAETSSVLVPIYIYIIPYEMMTALADVKREALKISNMWDISSYCFSAWLQEKLGQISTKRLSYPPNALLLVTCSPTPKPTAPPVSKAHSLAMRSTCAVECDTIWMNRTNRRTCTAPTANQFPI